MSEHGSERARSRNDSGVVLIAVLVDLTITVALMATVIGFLFFAVRLVQSAAPDSNPLLWSTLTSSVARLEGSLAPPLACSNPAGATTRTDCLTVISPPLKPIADPLVRADRRAVGDDALCWQVAHERADTNDDKRRLECWQLLNSGYLQVWVHDHAELDPDTGNPLNDLDGDGNIDLDPPLTGDPISGTADLLAITDWQVSPNPDLSSTVASGLTSLKWLCPTASNPQTECSAGVNASTVELLACAAIKPEQRNLMEPGFVPFCDGSTGVVLSDGSYRGQDDPTAMVDPDDWGTIEGYLLPAISVEIGNS